MSRKTLPPQVTGTPAFDAVLAALPVGVAIIDAQQRIVLVNAACCAALDVPPGSMVPGTPVAGTPLASLLPPDRQGRVRRAHNGREYDLVCTALPDGGFVACLIETTDLISARVEAEAMLARVTNALATWRGGVAAFQHDGTLLFVNPRFAELLDIPPSQVAVGMSFTAVLGLLAAREEFAGDAGKALLAAQRTLDRSQPSAARWHRPSGQVIWVWSDPLSDGGWTVTLADITLLAVAGEEGERRAGALAAILEAIPHGVCVYGADRRVTMFNHAYSRVMAGAPIAIGEDLSEIIRRRAAAGEYGPGAAEAVYSEQMAFDVSRPQMRRRRRPNGTVVDVRTAPLPDGGYISVVTDITPLTQAEAELSRHTQDLAAMLASIRQGIVLWGPDQRLIASNAIATELMNHPPGLLTPGRTQDEILGDMLQRGDLGDGERARTVAEDLRDRDRSRPYLRTITSRSGRLLDIRSDPTPGGGWVTTFTDVTEARRAQEELRRAKEAAEAANEAKSRFLATMSHELRTPLNAVIGFSDTLLRESDEPTPMRVAEFARQINESGRNLLGLINIILDVARIESGRFDLTSDRIDVARLIRGAVRQADAAAQAADITLVTELAEDLPALRGDERRLAQVLRHLLSNAVKFTEAGGTVTVGARMEADGGLLMYVRDNGIGISEVDLERVFEPFIQLESTLSRRFQGAGLGLYMSRAVIAGHGGTLTLQSEVGSGTVAEVHLPAAHVLTGRSNGSQ